MNKHLSILNELKACAEKDVNNSAWDIWFRGQYLGYIHKTDGQYMCLTVIDMPRVSMVKTNYNSAIYQFVALAYVTESLRANSFKTDNEFKRWGLSKKPSLLAKIKGWFYD